MPEIKKLDLNDPSTKSVDNVAGNLEALKALFPEAFTEGQIDFEVLKGLLGAAVDERDEKYGLNWHGKRRARQIAYLLPLPVHPETLAGYVQWRVFGGMAIVLLVWSILSASGAGRRL